MSPTIFIQIFSELKLDILAVGCLAIWLMLTWLNFHLGRLSMNTFGAPVEKDLNSQQPVT